jgi:hypothetical protein
MWGVMSCLRLGHRRKARRMKEEVGRKKEEQGNRSSSSAHEFYRMKEAVSWWRRF